ARQARKARPGEAAAGQGPSAARPLRGDAAQVRRDRPQLRGPRARVGRADPRAAGGVLQGRDVDLAFVIGRTARSVPQKDAMRYVAGYCIVNDVSEREFQLKHGASQWSKG